MSGLIQSIDIETILNAIDNNLQLSEPSLYIFLTLPLEREAEHVTF